MSADATATGVGSDLEDERDFLLRSLDDLDTEYGAGDLDPDDYRTLKDDYTARAAAVLRQLQRIDEPDREEAGTIDKDRGQDASRPRPGVRRSRWPLLLSIVGTLALAGGSGYLVTRTAGERLPGQQITDGIEQSPRDRLQQAVDLDNAGKLVEAAKLYDAVLAEDPENVVALARRGWVLGRSGRQAGSDELLQAALGYLDRATRIDPSFADAHAYKGLVLGALGRPGDAGCELRLWLSIAPIDDPLRPDIEGVLDKATQQAGGTLPDCPAPPIPVPVPADPAVAAPPTTSS